MVWTWSEKEEGRQGVLFRFMGVPDGRTIQHVRIRPALSYSSSSSSSEEPFSEGGDLLSAGAVWRDTCRLTAPTGGWLSRVRFFWNVIGCDDAKNNATFFVDAHILVKKLRCSPGLQQRS